MMGTKPQAAGPFDAIFQLSDEALLAETVRAASRERRAIAQLVAMIAEVDARRLYLQEGFPRTFLYCTGVLHLSRDAAYDRLRAAKAAQKFPVVLERLASGSLSLTNLKLLEPFLTAENYLDLLDQAAGKTRQEVEGIVAELRPALASPQTYKIQVVCSAETWQRLRRVQGLMRHSIPDGDVSRIFEKALTLLHADVEKRRFAKVEHPRGAMLPQDEQSRRPNAELRRQVGERDGWRCTFVGRHGRCPERENLELHHRQPWAKGGPTTLDNLELRCRAHNNYQAEQDFGKDVIAAARKRRQAVAKSRPEPKVAANEKPRRRPP